MRGEVILQIRSRAGWARLCDPDEIIEAYTLAEVMAKLRTIETAVEAGRYAAGFITYEAAPAFDSALQVRAPGSLPLLWFGLYDRIEPLDRPAGPDPSTHTLGEWTATVPWSEYAQSIQTIKRAIAAGETYQANYTYRLRAPFQGDPWDFFVRLARRQPAGYAAYVDTGRHVICSASPELFFQLAGQALTAQPMKGTAARGRTLAEDRTNRQWLQHSEKNRAENVMIVDMIRNDLGRVAEYGSVRVPSLFATERQPTVLQMTSTVTARTAATWVEVLTALFPCASITGAPKVRTMQIIAELETTPRGVYTGCIGYLAPNRAAQSRAAQFNVAIRTVTIDRATAQAEYGVGGGIVWDSEAADEYRECEIKTRVLKPAAPPFDLLESILWTPGEGCFLRERHMQRLADSAEYFDRALDEAALAAQIEALSVTLPPVDHKLQVRLSPQGRASVAATPLSQIPLPRPLRVTLATQPVHSDNPFLYHKTSQRTIYENARAAQPQFGDIILWNERGEITESTLANVVVDLDGRLFTPAGECGLLPGTYRGWLLDQLLLSERVIPIEEFKSARRIYLINSVRRWIDVQFDPAEY